MRQAQADAKAYQAPTVTEVGSVLDLTLANQPKKLADQLIPSGQPLTGS